MSGPCGAVWPSALGFFEIGGLGEHVHDRKLGTATVT